MADVQLENGYSRIANEILEKAALLKLSSLEHRILLTVWRYTYGFGRKEHELSISFLQKATDGDSRGIQRALKNMESNNIIQQRFESQRRLISFNKNYDDWNKTIGSKTLGDSTVGEITLGDSTEETLGDSTVGTLGKITYQERNKEKKKDTIPFKKIIDHLNEKTGKKFSGKTQKTKDLISARWNEGKRFEDFVLVIDYFSSKWSGVTFKDGQAAEKYLQPSTLFNGKFDERVNEALMSRPKTEVKEKVIERSKEELDSLAEMLLGG